MTLLGAFVLGLAVGASLEALVLSLLAGRRDTPAHPNPLAEELLRRHFPATERRWNRTIKRRVLRPAGFEDRMGSGPRAQASGELLSATVAESDTRRSLRAAAAVMRSTADRFDAVLSVESLSEGEALDRLTLEAGELCRAMATLDRELEERG